MVLMIIDGKKIATEIIDKLKQLEKPKKFLAAFLIGENSASESFIKQKEKTAAALGVDFRTYKFLNDISQDKLRKEALKIVLGGKCGGAIVQLPLPAHINSQYVLNAIPREKDVDVLGERALGAFYAGRNPALPPAVGAFEEISRAANYPLNPSRVAVVGLGNLVGKPIAVWCAGKVRELYLLDKGSDFAVLKQTDIAVCGAGVPGLIKPEMLKETALVVDFGYGLKNGKFSGDFDSESLKIKNYKLKINFTPTPGGTGPILVAILFENFFTLAKE